MGDSAHAENAGHVDDVGFGPFAQVRKKELGAVQRPPEVDVHHPLPLRPADLGQRHPGQTDAGVIDQYVHLAMRPRNVFGESGDTIPAGDIDDVDRSPAAAGPDCSGYLLYVFGIDIDEGDRAAFRDQLEGQGFSNARAGARDQGDFTG
jgi:hypothetical protein